MSREVIIDKNFQIKRKKFKHQLGFVREKETADAIFNVRRMQEAHLKKEKKLYMCFVVMEKAFDGVRQRQMESTMRKKGLLEVMTLAVMSLYDGAKMTNRVRFGFSEESEVKVGSSSRTCVVATVVCNNFMQAGV